MEVKLVSITPDAEMLIAKAYGICTGKRAIPVANIRKYVCTHPSPTEHASMTFEISGISRAASHQLVRHRIASFSQSSQRYVLMDDPEFITPPSIAESAAATETFFRFLDDAVAAYRLLRRQGIRKEDCRFVLPNATTTRIVVTMNFRSLRHFFSVRCDKAAQWEIRALATEMLRLAHREAPAVFQDLHEKFAER